MATIGTRIYTLFYGKNVGNDEFGNRYYRSKKDEGEHMGRPEKERRWVLYKGKAEPTKVPPQWHGWLHYTNDDVPDSHDSGKKYGWQKDHLPNLTGTKFAYRPSGHSSQTVEDGGKSSGNYEPWEPK